MEADEGVRVQPMSADTMPTVHHDDVDVCVVDQRIGERHPRRACADDQIVRFQDRRHGVMLTPPRKRVKLALGPDEASRGDSAAAQLFLVTVNESFGQLA